MSKLLKRAMGHKKKPQLAPIESANRALLTQAVELHREGRLADAANIYGQILKADDQHFDALHLLSVAAQQSGDPSGAVALIDRALKVSPQVSDAWTNRSSILMDLGRIEEAKESCDRAVELDPKSAEAYFNRGNALSRLGKRREAMDSYRQSLALKPEFLECMLNLAGESIDEGNFEEAAGLLSHVLTAEPMNATAWLTRGVLSQEQGEKSSAMDAYQKALEFRPGYVKAIVNLANMAFEDGRVSDAVSYTQAALKIEPSNPEAHNSIANCYRALGDPGSAAEHYRKAVQHGNNALGHHSNLILCLLGDPEVDADGVLDEALKYGARNHRATDKMAATSPLVKRIGFVSGDLRAHPVGFFLEPLLQNLRDVETVLFANQLVQDRQSAVLRDIASEWHDTRSLSTQDLANLARSRNLDVLIDLSGHTAEGRLDVFAERVAPVQLSWLGFSGTTGVGQFDGLVVDRITVPRSHEDRYSEPIVVLPSGFVPFFQPKDLSEVSSLPAEKYGYVTFGSFNATTKVNDRVLDAWCQVLLAVPSSKLVMKSLFLADPLVQNRYASAFVSRGIDLSRVCFLGHSERADHWSTFSEVDIALDTFPYTGATTTLESLWMGIPVVTLLGDRYCGRMSASFLRGIGLDDFVTSSVDDYVAKASDVAGDWGSLATLRKGLRSRIAESAQADGPRFAMEFLETVQSAWCEKLGQAA